MSSSGIAFILSISDARRSTRTGAKAVSLSKLAAAHFAVPRGFVISADCYRSHLWASGAREAAAAEAEAEDRVGLRNAIVAAEIPDDVWQAIVSAYERLSWQCGVPEPPVAVRSSAIEDIQGQQSFAGAYETYLNVSGREALKLAVKRVWASLWTGKAAAYRARTGASSEPAMAVIVQQMVDAERCGTVATANPVTGDPRAVSVCCTLPADEPGGASLYELSLGNLALPADVDSPESQFARHVAEKAILIEELYGCPVEIDWAHYGDRLWMLQARPMADLPAYFPTDWEDDAYGKIEWLRLTTGPISTFARSLLRPERKCALPHPPRLSADKTHLVNGCVYAHRPAVDEAQADALPREVAAGTRMLAQWQSEVEPTLRSATERPMRSDLSNLSHRELQSMLKAAADASRAALHWLEAMRCPCVRFPQLLQSALESAAGTQAEEMRRELLGGLPDPTVIRDARLRELGERVRIAEDRGKIDNPEWGRELRRDVDAFARDFGCSFVSAAGLYDISSWKSWIEDTDSLFRIIAALAQQDKRPTLVTLHFAAQVDAMEAAAEATKLFKGASRKRFEDILLVSRSYLARRNEAEQVYALACTGLRLVLAEVAGRMRDSGILAETDDVFHLTLDELLASPTKPSASDRTSLAVTVAARKHELWLEKRLTAPDTLPINNAHERMQADSVGTDGPLRGTPASPGAVSARARVARTLSEASEVRNGEILVVEQPTLAWTPFLAVAGGFVSAGRGDCPVEAALIRDYGIPAVTECSGALEAIGNGQRIAVNGSDGTVTLR